MCGLRSRQALLARQLRPLGDHEPHELRDPAHRRQALQGAPETLLIGLGIAACEQGRRVRYATAAQLVNELAEAADERRLSRIVARYGRLDLLCLDELGYIQLDARGSELLFQILTEREEKASVALATNLPFSEWGTVIPDPRLVAAIVDRVTFNAHILETGTNSYRLRTTRTRRKTA
jgi:DNA replication protein DnaC